VSAPRPLPNRVDPFGALVATPARGLLMGNRGGRFHRDDRTLGRPRWKTKAWIACVCQFNGRWREVWGPGYTELFFLDEVTALAAGHRPCGQCRHADAQAFAAAFPGGGRPAVAQMDVILDAERRDGHAKRLWERPIAQLPDGAMIAIDGRAFAVRGDALLPWRFEGYGAPLKRPGAGVATALTPPSILAVLTAGYGPRWAGPAS